MFSERGQLSKLRANPFSKRKSPESTSGGIDACRTRRQLTEDRVDPGKAENCRSWEDLELVLLERELERELEPVPERRPGLVDREEEAEGEASARPVSSSA